MYDCCWGILTQYLLNLMHYLKATAFTRFSELVCSLSLSLLLHGQNRSFNATKIINKWIFFFYLKIPYPPSRQLWELLVIFLALISSPAEFR